MWLFLQFCSAIGSSCVNKYVYIYTHVFCTGLVHGDYGPSIFAMWSLRPQGVSHTPNLRRFAWNAIERSQVQLPLLGLNTLGSNEQIPGEKTKNHVNKKTPWCFFGEVIVLSYKILYIYWKKTTPRFLAGPHLLEVSGFFWSFSA